MTFIFLALAITGMVENSRSANLQQVSVTLSNSRPSFRGSMDTNVNAGSSLVRIVTDNGVFPSTASSQLQVGDTVSIGSGGDLGSYTVASIDTTSLLDQSMFNVSPVLGATHVDPGDDIIASMSSTLTVRFTTANGISNGAFRILVPADPDVDAARDGIPDSGAFEFGTVAPTVTCPSNISGYTFETGTASSSAILLGGVNYHAYECRYSGTGGEDTVFDGTTNDAIVIDSVINPAPRDNTFADVHTLGYADAHKIILQHWGSTVGSDYVLYDSTAVSIGVIEAVRVTAEVAPLITFRIIGVGSGVSACGANTTVATTSTVVPLGILNIDEFTRAAQELQVSTNAPNGYVVTTRQSDQLTREGQTCVGTPTTDSNCIRDAEGDTAAMTPSNSDEWTVTTAKGFGYTLDNIGAGGTAVFEHDSNAVDDCTSGDPDSCYRQFNDSEANSNTPVQIFSYDDTTEGQQFNVCYKAVIPVTQAAGLYSNYLTYTATATF